MGAQQRAFGLVFAIFASAPLGAIALSADALADTVIHQHYDGTTNDLLTAGLGATGLGSATPPAVSNATQPTAEDLRRLAIYYNYRALVDPTSGGGFGTLYGPTVAVPGYTPQNDGMIGGDEYLTFDKGYDGRAHVTLMVQVPDSFDPHNACLVTAPSSGSRGIYGAIATAGEWGLKHGCAVAYTDKGSGIGAHDLQNDLVNLIQGQQVSASQAGDDAIFKARLNGSDLAAFNIENPNRFAFKHAHSQENPERDWGKNVLSSIRFAFRILGGKFGGKVTKRNTIVIASSVSNGGGASLRAVEEDTEGLIDGAAVGEPNVNPTYLPAFTIQQGSNPPLRRHSRPLIDYITLMDVYQGCANGAPANATAPLNVLYGAAAARCASLHSLGLLKSVTPADQATEAQQIINDYGILTEQNIVQPFYWYASVSRSISVTYANSYARASVKDNLCNFSFAAIGATNHPAPDAPALEAVLFGMLNGIPPSESIALINNAADTGPTEDRASVNNGVADQNLTGALCLRSIANGKDAVTGDSFSLNDPRAGFAYRIREGVEEILASGRLHGVPATIVTGRNDGILPPNFASRAYYGLNKTLESSKSPIYYYEVMNAHHLDSLNQYPGFNSDFIPLHRYYIQALDLMYSHLKNKTPLPPSQVVRTTPRGTGSPQITLANVPPILQSPAAADTINFTTGKVYIPE